MCAACAHSNHDQEQRATQYKGLPLVQAVSVSGVNKRPTRIGIGRHWLSSTPWENGVVLDVAGDIIRVPAVS